MRKYDILIIWNKNKRELRHGTRFYYLFLKVRFLFSNVDVSII